MKTAIFNLAFGDAVRKVSEFSWPTVERWAKRIGAVAIRSGTRKYPNWPAFYEKFQIGELLNEFDRMIWIDADAVVRRDCPNLFEIVPLGSFAGFNQASVDVRPDRFREKVEITEKALGLNPIPWDGIYLNSGVMVFDREHRGVFSLPKSVVSLKVSTTGEQEQLNLARQRLGIPFFNLTDRFNMMVSPKRGNYDIERAYILHYPWWFGHLGYRMEAADKLLARMKEDSGKWEKFLNGKG